MVCTGVGLAGVLAMDNQPSRPGDAGRYPTDARLAERHVPVKSLIEHNAKTIAELHRRVHDTVRDRDRSDEHRNAWRAACSEFHSRYDALAFVGGVSTARERIRAGDAIAIEYALSFIEVRPYFFRSGYMYNDFLRVLRNAELSPRQRERYNRVYEAYREYRRARVRSGPSG